MGGFGEILRGLGRFGSEAGTAAQGLAEERRRQLRDEWDRLNMRINYSDWQQRMKQAGVAQYRGTFETPDGSLYAIQTDPGTGQISTRQLYKSSARYPEFRTLEEAATWGLTHGDQELVKQATETREKMLRGPQTSAASQEYADWRAAFVKRNKREPNDREIRDFLRNPPTGAGGFVFSVPEAMLKALADKWQNEGIKPPAKLQPEVEEYMEQKGMKAQVKLSTPERTLARLTQQIEPKVQQLQKLIEQAGLQGDNSLVFSNHSALMQHLRFYKYKAGVAPEKLTSDLIKAAAALQVMGAGPWMAIGRGRYMFETIVQHLPSPTDTPALLYDKMRFLQTILDEAKASLPEGWQNTFGGAGKTRTLDDILNEKFGQAPTQP